MQLSWSELNKKMMEPVEPRNSRQAVEQQMVAINNAADWEVDLAPGLLAQVVDLTPYVNTSALKVRHTRLVTTLPHCLFFATLSCVACTAHKRCVPELFLCPMLIIADMFLN